MAKFDLKIMKALIKHKKQMNRKPLWGAEVMLYLQGNCSNDTNLIHNGQFFILNEFCKEFLPQVCLWILSPKKTKEPWMHLQKQSQDKKIHSCQSCSSPGPPKSLYTCHGHSGFYMSTTCVTHSHPNMSEHIEPTQTRYSQLLVVEHGLKTSQDPSH